MINQTISSQNKQGEPNELMEYQKESRSVYQHPEKNFPFEMQSFHQCWWRHLSSRFNIPFKGRELLIHRKKIAKGLLSLSEVRIAGWNTAWDQSLTDDRLSELQQLQQTNQWDYFRLRLKVNHDLPQSTERLAATGFPSVMVPAPCQYSIDLSQGLDVYMKGLSHNSRKSLKKKTRLAQVLKPRLVTVEEPKAVEQFLEALIHHHIQYWDQKVGHSYLNHPEEKQFLYHWALALHQSGHLVLDRLMMNDQTVNLSLGVRCDDAFYWLFTVNTGLFSEYAPGIVGLNLRLEGCAQQNIQQFHMGSGDYFYKIQSANVTLPCADVYVINPNSWKGKLYHRWLKRKHRGDIQVLQGKF